MKAAVLTDPGAGLELQEVPDPVAGAGAVVVRLLAAFVPGAMKKIMQADVSWALPQFPFIPGVDAVGVVDEVGDRVHGLRPGQMVYCDNYVTLAGKPEVGAYVGLFGTMPGASAVLEEWRHGSYAEKFVLPAGCLTVIDPTVGVAPELLARLGYIGTSYHAMRRGCFEPGQTVVVNGAAGVLGVGTVWLLLALGAARVVVADRRRNVLEELRKLDPKRVAVVEWTGKPGDAELVIEAAGGRAHLFIDAVGLTDTSATTTACIGALGAHGYAVLMGGVNAGVCLEYATQMIGLQLTVRGSEWYPRAAVKDLLNMAASGVLDFSCFRAANFRLEHAQDALDAAESKARGFAHVVIVPEVRQGG